MLKRAAPNGAASDSFCHRCEVTPHSALPLWALRIAQRRATARMELSARFKILRTEPNRGPSDCRAKDRGGKQHCCQSTAAFRRESIGRLKAADKTASCRNERSLW